MKIFQEEVLQLIIFIKNWMIFIMRFPLRQDYQTVRLTLCM